MDSTYQEGAIVMSIDLSEYEKMLNSLNLARENQIPYMLNWVRKYIHSDSPEETEYADILLREGREVSPPV